MLYSYCCCCCCWAFFCCLSLRYLISVSVNPWNISWNRVAVNLIGWIIDKISFGKKCRFCNMFFVYDFNLIFHMKAMKNSLWSSHNPIIYGIVQFIQHLRPFLLFCFHFFLYSYTKFTLSMKIKFSISELKKCLSFYSTVFSDMIINLLRVYKQLLFRAEYISYE